MTDDLERLRELREEIHGAEGADDLAAACAEAAAVPGFGGDPAELRAVAEYCETVAHSVQQAVDAAEPLRGDDTGRVGAGGAHEALRALSDDMSRALSAFRTVCDEVRRHAEQVRHERRDEENAASLAEVAASVGSLAPTARPGPMVSQRRRAIAAIDGRIATHLAMRDAAEDFATALHEVEVLAPDRSRSPFVSRALVGFPG
jgi:hypothetical protein